MLLAIPRCTYLYYVYQVDDEIGSQYNQTWVSEDGKISFVTNNKKGLNSDNMAYEGKINIDGEEKQVNVGFDGSFVIDNYEEPELYIYSEDYHYYPIIKKLVVNVERTIVDEYKNKEIVIHKK